ncbi:MAG: hypothetical protein ABFS12_13255 [Bacteroidota bacterium]
MKIGCFLKTIALIVILIGISFYLYKKYGNQVINAGKEKVEEFIAEKIQTSIDELTESFEKDSLQKSLDELLVEIKEKELSFNSDDYEKLIEEINDFIDSNKVSSESIEGIEKLVEEYEGRKKD